MGTFSASLRVVGDRKGLDATVEVNDGRLSIAAGDTTIGDWSISDIELEEMSTGYRMSAEGDQILLEFQDLERFSATLEAARPKRRGSRRKGKEPKATKDPKPAKEPRAKKTKEPKHKESRRRPRGRKQDAEPKPIDLNPSPVAAAPAEPAATVPTLAPVAEPEAAKEGPNAFVKFMDGTLDRAERRWGNLLPRWVFSRGAFLGIVGLILVALLFPGVVSTLLLVAGLAGLMVGGVAYMDDVVASKWLPGRMNATHLLVTGVGLILVSIVFGVIA